MITIRINIPISRFQLLFKKLPDKDLLNKLSSGNFRFVLIDSRGNEVSEIGDDRSVKLYIVRSFHNVGDKKITRQKSTPFGVFPFEHIHKVNNNKVISDELQNKIHDLENDVYNMGYNPINVIGAELMTTQYNGISYATLTRTVQNGDGMTYSFMEGLEILEK